MYSIVFCRVVPPDISSIHLAPYIVIAILLTIFPML